MTSNDDANNVPPPHPLQDGQVSSFPQVTTNQPAGGLPNLLIAQSASGVLIIAPKKLFVGASCATGMPFNLGIEVPK